MKVNKTEYDQVWVCLDPTTLKKDSIILNLTNQLEINCSNVS